MKHNVRFMLLHHWYPDLLSSCHLILHQEKWVSVAFSWCTCNFSGLSHLDNLYSALSRMGRLYQMGLLLFPLMDFFFIYIEKVDISSWNYWKSLPTVSIYEGVSHNFCLTSDGFGVANASSRIKLTWTFIMHIFLPDRFYKLLEENLLRERTANFFYVFLFGAKV
ncbi:hypothetical protein RGQ29_001411 [Quercus rubra]|uniref:Uncharacterized protein n=1 Tax=Quercus rubra TaxID=3512 RepID=A0AAN7G906_QUERU|nr:hypothetical protein RGQ29_001411 [Quercus rubra]